MAGSKIVAVRKGVVTGLKTVTALTTPNAAGLKPLIEYFWTAKQSDRYRIWTANAEFTHEPASLKTGRTFRNERATFEVWVHVEGIGLDIPETADIAMTYGLAVEEWVADNRTTLAATIPGLNWLVVAGSGRLDEAPGDRGSLAQFILPLEYDARLT